ncbi:MAG TPA: beta-N-acetylhexosaminidase [Draconibacterium sp.]|nr:beta-N-acetylhexosaminidase [Draconibacterium sp.]
MRSILKISLLMAIFFQFSCTTKTPADLTQTAFIPKPVSVTATGGDFEISGTTIIYIQDGLQQTGAYLSGAIEKISGFTPEIVATKEAPANGIYLSLSASSPDLGEEGYEMTIGKKLITISATSPAGCFNGIQTLLQTMPVKAPAREKLHIPTGEIRDFPEYAYRGAMLDVGRHFFSVEEVKQFIDYMAMYKLNALHIGLTNDQGWRIEIKSWPKLSEIGGSTEVGGGPGGFYTQEQYSELVKYAQDRNITIIPEIDMPGHTNAALASYAELNCDGKARDLYTGIEVGFSTLCTGKEITYQFIDDVFGELAALTPGEYIHIGGDESHATPLEDYIPFVNRVQQIVLKHGKKVVGWDEIANATLVENSAVQFWDNVKNTTMALEQGAKVVISPAKKAYLDMQYDSTSTFGLHWAGYIEVDTGYNWEPLEQVPGIKKEQIVGIEAALWTETVSNMDEVEYLVFPRLPGYAEISWAAPNTRNWDEYKVRLGKQNKRFDALEIDYFPSARVPWEE